MINMKGRPAGQSSLVLSDVHMGVSNFRSEQRLTRELFQGKMTKSKFINNGALRINELTKCDNYASE